jgi:hypothetical protein
MRKKHLTKTRRRPVAHRPNPALKAIPEQKRKNLGRELGKET